MSLPRRDHRRAPTRHAKPVRWVDGLAGALLVGAVAATVLIAPTLITTRHAAVPAAAAPAAVPGPAVDEQSCLETTRALDDLGQAVTAAGGPQGDAVAAAADSARSRVARQEVTSSSRLRPVVTDLVSALGGFLEAVRTDGTTTTATDELLQLIDRLDASCQVALAPGSVTAPMS